MWQSPHGISRQLSFPRHSLFSPASATGKSPDQPAHTPQIIQQENEGYTGGPAPDSLRCAMHLYPLSLFHVYSQQETKECLNIRSLYFLRMIWGRFILLRVPLMIFKLCLGFFHPDVGSDNQVKDFEPLFQLRCLKIMDITDITVHHSYSFCKFCLILHKTFRYMVHFFVGERGSLRVNN